MIQNGVPHCDSCSEVIDKGAVWRDGRLVCRNCQATIARVTEPSDGFSRVSEGFWTILNIFLVLIALIGIVAALANVGSKNAAVPIGNWTIGLLAIITLSLISIARRLNK